MKYWFISAPLYSHTDWGGFLPTAQALVQAGQDVLWISEAPLKNSIEHADIAFQAIEHTGWLWPPPPPPDFTTIPPQEAVMLRYTRALDTWLSEDLVAKAVTDLLNLANEIGLPDVIVTDPFLSASALVAEKLGVPMVVCGWVAQQSMDENALFPVQQNLGSDSQRRLARLFDQFELTGTNFSSGSTPSITSPHLHISYFTPDWYGAEAHLLLPQNQFVGGKPKIPTDEPPKWLTAIPANQPLGVVTLGTIFTGDLGFFSWSAQSIAREGLLPVVSIGWNPIEPARKQELIHALPGGTRLLNWIPLEHVLPRTKLMIHHGGMGTTHKAIVHGVPQIVVPHAADQRIQGRRVAQMKIGLHLTAHDVRQGQLWEGARAILQSEKVQEDAQKFANEMVSYGGVERARKLLLTVS